jgi:hypothetical protein
MIVACNRCGRQYDVTMLATGTGVSCECGDVLIVPAPRDATGGKLIECYLERLAKETGINLSDAKVADGWQFLYGSARIRLRLAADDRLVIESTIMAVPGDASAREKLFRKLLELNRDGTGEARFALSGNEVIVTFARSTLGLDYEEFLSAAQSVCRAADDHDDMLRKEFGGSAGGAPEEIQLGRDEAL